jgi:hypothetical protein
MLNFLMRMLDQYRDYLVLLVLYLVYMALVYVVYVSTTADHDPCFKSKNYDNCSVLYGTSNKRP